MKKKETLTVKFDQTVAVREKAREIFGRPKGTKRIENKKKKLKPFIYREAE